MQVRILGPVLYTVVGQKVIPLERIDPAKATKALQQLGYRDEAAWLIARGRLDRTQARRLGQKYGLIAREEVVLSL